MDTFRHQLTIDAPVHRVFEIMGDMERQARMMADIPIVQGARITPSSAEAGRMEIDVAGKTLQADYRVSREPPHRIRYHADGDWSERGEATLEPTPEGGTRLSYEADYELAGVTGRLLSVLAIDERLARRHLERVKAEAEGAG